jgi:hypothetical protein
MFESNSPRRLMAVLLAGALVLLMVFWLSRAQRELNASLEIERLGAVVHYAWRLDSAIQLSRQGGGSPWRLFPGDAYVDGVVMAPGRTPLSKRQLNQLQSFSDLRWLSLAAALVTDASLDEVAELSSLRWLALNDTPVSDAGMDALSRLNRLQCLDLRNTLVTDQGLPKLAALKQLERLDLRGTNITSKGLVFLRTHLPKTRIHVD